MSATGAAKDVKGSQCAGIAADNRTNRIIIKGDTATRKRIRQMIEMLDVPAADRLGGLKVFRLKYASAQNFSRNFARSGFRTGGEQQLNANSNSNNNSASNSSSTK